MSYIEEYELFPRYDSAKSFYGKAHEIWDYDNSIIKLRSYSTIVAEIDNGKATVFGWYSQTTGRHIKEFLKQHGFVANNKTQILDDYEEEVL